MKVLFVISIALFFGSFGVAENVITWGSVTQYDVLLYREIIKKSSSFLKVVSMDVTYPMPYHFSNRTITAIRLTNQMPEGKEGHAQIVSGGVGFTNVSIHFKSQRNKGFNFIMEIFGR
jgi:Transcription activator MBF2